MHKKKEYIIVKDRHPRISEVKNDCVNLCVPAGNGESLASILQKICSKITNNYSSLVDLIDDIPEYFVEAGDNVTVTGDGSSSDPWVVSSLFAANNGLSVNSNNIVLGQNVGETGNPAALLSNREIPLANFSLKFSNTTAGEGVTILPNRVNSGVDNHFSSANIVGYINATLSGPSTNILTNVDVASGGIGKYGAGYFDTRMTLQNNTSFTLRFPSGHFTGLDFVNATTTYNNWNNITGFTHTFSRISIGGPRRQSGYSGTTTINFPSLLADAMPVDRIQFNFETNHAKVVTGHAAGLVVESRVFGTGPFNWYTDILIGRRHGDSTMTYATRNGLYILPVKTSNVTVGYGIYQEGTTDQNYFGGLLGIGATANHASAKFQVDSTTQGMLPPRMTTVQRDAISSPAAGLVIYNTTTNKLNVRTASSWEAVTSA